MCSNQQQEVEKEKKKEEEEEEDEEVNNNSIAILSSFQNMNINTTENDDNNNNNNQKKEEEEEQQQQQQIHYYHHYYNNYSSQQFETLSNALVVFREELLARTESLQNDMFQISATLGNRVLPHISRYDKNTIIIHEGNGNSGCVIGTGGIMMKQLLNKYPGVDISVPKYADIKRDIIIHNCSKIPLSAFWECGQEILNLLSLGKNNEN